MENRFFSSTNRIASTILIVIVLATFVYATTTINSDRVETTTVFADNINSSSGSPLSLQTNGITRIYINDSTGTVNIGTTKSIGGKSLYIQAGTGGLFSSANIVLERNIGAEFGASYRFRKSRGNVDARTVGQDGDSLGRVIWQAFNGTGAEDYRDSAIIRATIDGVASATNAPAKFEFKLIEDGSGDKLPTTVMTIRNNGSVGMGVEAPARQLHINDTLRLQPRSTAPTNPSLGDIYVDSDTNELCFYNSTDFVGLIGGGILSCA